MKYNKIFANDLPAVVKAFVMENYPMQSIAFVEEKESLSGTGFLVSLNNGISSQSEQWHGTRFQSLRFMYQYSFMGYLLLMVMYIKKSRIIIIVTKGRFFCYIARTVSLCYAMKFELQKKRQNRMDEHVCSSILLFHSKSV